MAWSNGKAKTFQTRLERCFEVNAIMAIRAYNDNNEFDHKLPETDYNFQADIEEMEQPGHYDPDLAARV